MLNGVSSAPSPPSPSTMSGFRQVRLLHTLSGRIGLFSVEKTQPSFLLTKALPGRRVLPPESQLPTFPAPPFRCPFLGSSASLQPNGERDSQPLHALFLGLSPWQRTKIFQELLVRWKKTEHPDHEGQGKGLGLKLGAEAVTTAHC